MTIGELIKIERMKNHLSQEEVAKAIGSTKQAVYKYENGIVSNIPMDKIEVMAKLFGVTPSYLMGWESDRKTLDLQLFASDTPSELSEGERMLLDLFRQIPPDKQELVLQMIRVALGNQG